MNTLKAIAASLSLLLLMSSASSKEAGKAPEINFDKMSNRATATVERNATALQNSETALPKHLYEKDVANYAENLKWQRDFVTRTWEWHLLSTKILFFIVIGTMFFGLCITYLQFRKEYGVQRPTRRAKVSAPDAPPADDPLPATNHLKIGPEGLELTSQVIGFFVLAFSLAFFYFYVKDVYPLQEVELQRKAEASRAEVEKTPARAPTP